jgi:hypothetical protein
MAFNSIALNSNPEIRCTRQPSGMIVLSTSLARNGARGNLGSCGEVSRMRSSVRMGALVIGNISGRDFVAGIAQELSKEVYSRVSSRTNTIEATADFVGVSDCIIKSDTDGNRALNCLDHPVQPCFQSYL